MALSKIPNNMQAPLALATSDMPAGSVLNVTQAAYTGTTSVSSGQAGTPIAIFQQTVTPKSAGSQFLIQIEVKASHTPDNSMYFTCNIDGNRGLFGRDSTIPAATNSWYIGAATNTHIYDASHQIYMGNYLFQRGSGNGLTSFDVVVECRHQGGTAYINKSYQYDDSARGKPRSTLTITEIKV